MKVKKIGIIGAGTMGHGIALVSAQAGFEVILRDTTQELMERGMQRIARFCEKSVSKEKMTETEKKSILDRIVGVTDLDKLKDVDVVIEAVFENPQVKKDIFQELDRICKKECLFASNTSTIPITGLAAATKRGNQFIGMHFMNPVPLMKLVEVICGLRTSDETTQVITSLAEKMGKIPVQVNDYPGFVSNRVLLPMINEAAYCLMEGVATRESIDQVMKLGMNHPMGPLQLADLIGLDICLDIMTVLHEGFGDSKYRPCPLLKKMVQAGYLGKKTGRGFYEYK